MKNLKRNHLATAMALAWLGAASAAVHAQAINLGDLGSGGFKISGAEVSDFSGHSVSGAGDVNGDGLADLIVGAFRAGTQAAGASYVVFGRASAKTLELASLDSAGFRIDGMNSGDISGISVSGAGDVNGDGLADLIVGASQASPGGNLFAGESYVVFGRTSTTPVDLTALGSDGFRIEGDDEGDGSGYSVSGAGDVNGDGLADLIVGTYADAIVGAPRAGRSHVVFGKANTTPVDLATLGDGGFRIEGIDVFDGAGHSVSGAGDVNGDGLADLIVGAYAAAPGGRARAGESYVVFGRVSSSVVELAALGSGGFRIDGISSGDQSGRSVAAAGDVNGDGLADLLVGARGAKPSGVGAAGESYVVFGKASSTAVDLRFLRSGGFRIGRSGLFSYSDSSGWSVAGAGDVNGDGLADLIIGAPHADGGGIFSPATMSSGESYLVFGKASTEAVDLAAFRRSGVRIDGVDALDMSGVSVSAAGDVNGDGLADLIVGAFTADVGGRTDAGESYVVFSPALPPPAATYRARSANGNPPRSAVGVVGDGSNDSHPDARLWIDFANGSDPAASASTEIVTLTRSRGNFRPASANVHWQIQSTRQNWTAAEVRVRYLDSELSAVGENALKLVFSPTGAAPFEMLNSVVNPRDNTISANISQPGFLYLRVAPLVFANGVKTSP